MAFDRRETAILLIGDFFILIASLWAALGLRNLAVPSLSYLEANLIPFLPIFCLSLVVFYIAGLYEKQTRPVRSVMGIRVLGAQAATVAIAAILFFVLPLSIAPKTILVLYLIISVVAESAWRFYWMQYEIQEGQRERAVLYGSSPAARELYDEVRRNNRYRINFVERRETEGAERVEIETARGTIVFDLASLYEEIFDRVSLDHSDEAQLLAFASQRRELYDGAKRLFDIVLAAIGLVIALPLVLIAALLLALMGGTPFIFPERVGRGGRPFRLVKLRTMLFDDGGDPQMHKKNRVTALGRILRKTRIDELPQLVNVLAGELSFIGPRPELPNLVAVYEREVPRYRLRHLVAPGLSGWGQIHDYDVPRGGVDVERTKRKLSYDLYYLKHRSFALDLAIAVKTVRTLLAFSGT